MVFNKVLIFILFIVVLSCSSTRQEKTDSIPLWLITTEDTKIYILGSTEYADSSIYPLDNTIIKGFNESESLVLTSVDFQLSPDSAASLNTLYMDGSNIRDYLRTEHYNKIINRFKAFDIEADAFSQIKAWLAVETLHALELRKSGFLADFSIENHFLELANDKNKIELEPLTARFRYKNKNLGNYEDLYAGYILNKIERNNSEIRRIRERWRYGDTEELSKIFFDFFDQNPTFEPVYREFYKNRNRDLAEKVIHLIKKGGSYFLVMDIERLIGPDGILNILWEKRYILIGYSKLSFEELNEE